MSTLTLERPAALGAEPARRPLLLLDVDGVLNPDRRPSEEWQKHRCMVDGRGYNLWLNPSQGKQLLALVDRVGCDLVWATSWEHHANQSIAPILGLPELPVIHVDQDSQWRNRPPLGVMWKTPKIAQYVDGRPFVWLDDDFLSRDEAFLAAAEGVGEFLLIDVEAKQGLTDGHLEQAAAWLAKQSGGA